MRDSSSGVILVPPELGGTGNFRIRDRRIAGKTTIKCKILIVRFPTHSRDLDELLSGNDSYGRPATFIFHKNKEYLPKKTPKSLKNSPKKKVPEFAEEFAEFTPGIHLSTKVGIQDI